MTLSDAVEHAAKLVPNLKGRDAIAVHVLVEAARRMVKARPALRQLSAALGLQEEGESHLNQTPMFADVNRDEKK